jgi:hypothetical protein
MTPAEFLAALDKAGWNFSELARRLGCDSKLPQRWAHGTATIPYGVARWLRGVATYHRCHPAPTDWRVRK